MRLISWAPFILCKDLEAALKYWNAIDKAASAQRQRRPNSSTSGTQFGRAVAFKMRTVLSGESLLTTQARLENLGIFSMSAWGLRPRDEHSTPRCTSRSAMVGDSKLEGADKRLLGGLPYAPFYPEIYNLDIGDQFHFAAALGFGKARASEIVDTGVRQPGTSLADYFDARNENWTLSRTFFGVWRRVT